MVTEIHLTEHHQNKNSNAQIYKTYKSLLLQITAAEFHFEGMNMLLTHCYVYHYANHCDFKSESCI